MMILGRGGRFLATATALVLMLFPSGGNLSSGSSAVHLAPTRARRAMLAPHVPGELLVKFREDADAGRRSRALAGLAVTELRQYRRGLQRLRLDGGLSTADAVARLRGKPGIEFVEPNYLVRAARLPDDPRLPELYGLINTGQLGGMPGADISAEAAWEITTGGEEVVVAVIDTGIDYTHPDLAANIWSNPGEIPDNGIDDDGNGFIDDTRGWDFADDDNDPIDINGHGTHVAGIIGAVGNNGIGTTGVAWKVRLVPLRFIRSDGLGTVADAVAAVEYATSIGARITNNSWTGAGFSRALVEAIDAAGAAGSLFIAAAGNEANDNDRFPTYPASLELANIISVAASDAIDGLAPFSNFGATSVDIAAPGAAIISTLPGNGYGPITGTSMSAPHVAGSAALILSLVPGMPAAEVKRMILQGADPLPVFGSFTVAGGRLNAYRPISNQDVTPPGSIDDLRVVEVSSNTVRLGWTATGDDQAGGTASSYELLYSTSPIATNDPAGATRRRLDNPPLPAGSRESVEVAGLDSATAYYLTLVARDDWDNAGAPAVVVEATTLEAPGFSAGPASFEITLRSGERAVRELTLGNPGAGRLDWTIPIPLAGGIPNPTPAGAAVLAKDEPDPRFGEPVVNNFGGPDAYGYRWVTSDAPEGPSFEWSDIEMQGTLVDLDDDDRLSPPVALGFSFPFYGDSHEFVRVSSNGWLAFANGPASFTNQPLPNPGAPPALIAPFWDDLDFGEGFRATYVLRDDEFTLQFTDVPRYSGPGSYTFQVTLRSSGEIVFRYLAMTGARDGATVGIQNGAGDTGLLVAFNAAFAHDDLAVRFDRTPLWFSASPSSGRIDGAGTRQVDLLFDTAGLEPGLHESALRIETNSPQAPLSALPVRLELLAAPAIRVTPGQLDFGELFAGGSATLAVEILNVGAESLQVGEIAGNDPAIAVNPANLVLAPGERTTIDVTYAPTEAGTLAAELTVPSNAVALPVARLDLSGRAAVAPGLTVSPASLAARLAQGRTERRELLITNTGVGELSVTLTFLPATPEAGADPIELANGGFELRNFAGWSATTNGRFALESWDVVGENSGFFGTGSPIEGTRSAYNGFDGEAGTEFLLTREIELPADVSWAELSYQDRVQFDSLGIPSEAPRIYESRLLDALGEVLAPITHQEFLINGRSYTDLGWQRRSIDLTPYAGEKVWLQLREFIPESLTGPGMLEFDDFRIEAQRFPEWLRADTARATVAPGATIAIGLTFAAGDRWPALLAGQLVVDGGDPLITPAVVPVELTIAGTPRVSVDRGNVSRSSNEPYFSGGAATVHEMEIEVLPVGGATISLSINGDYGAANEMARLLLGERPIAALGGLGQDCVGASQSFPIDAETFAESIQDGTVSFEIRNTPIVGTGCFINRHSVVLFYRGVLDRVEFDELFIGQSQERSVWVRNLGTADLTVVPVVSGMPDVSSSAESLDLAPGDSAELRLTFAPGIAGASKGTLSLATNDPDRPLWELPLSGAAIDPPAVTVDRTSIVATLLAGQAGSEPLSIANLGDGELTYGLSLVPAGTTFARLVGGAGALAPGGSTTAAIQLRTVDLPLGNHQALLRIETNDPARPLIVVPLSVLITPGPHVTVSERPLLEQASADFLGPEAVNRFELPISDSPVGRASLELSVTGDFSSTDETATVTIDGLTLGSLASDSEECGTSSQSFPIDAQTFALMADDGQVELVVRNSLTVDSICPVNRHTVRLRYGREITRLEFGVERAGTRPVRVLSIENTGSAPLSAQTVGTGNPVFSALTPFIHLQPGQTEPLPIRFSPQASGDFEGLLTLVTNAPDQFHVQIELAGTAAASSPVTASPNAFSVAMLVGDRATRSLTLTNGGDEPLTLSLQAIPTLPAQGSFVALAAESLSLPANGSAQVEVRLDARGLPGERHEAVIHLTGEELAGLSVPVTLLVSDAPNASVTIQPVVVESERFFTGNAARTTHRLEVPIRPGGSGRLRLTAEGDFGSPNERAVLFVDGVSPGSVGSNGDDCTPVADTLIIDAETFAAQATDGLLEVVVQNNDPVNIVCAVNRHAIRLTYDTPELLDFGRIFLGRSQQRIIEIANEGSAHLAVQSIVSGIPDVASSVTNVAIFPGTQRTVELTFAPTAPGEYEAPIFIVTDDPTEPVIELSARAVAVDPPVFELASTTVDRTLPEGGRQSLPVTIDNPGGSPLFVTVETLPDLLPFAVVVPSSVVVPPGGTAELTVTLDAAGLEPGLHQTPWTIASNDPDRLNTELAIRLTVDGAPDIVGPGERIELASTVSYAESNGRSLHRFVLPAAASGVGSVRVIGEGDFGPPDRNATIAVEGAFLGRIDGGAGDCSSTEATFQLDPATLSIVAEDGTLEVEVHNSTAVQPTCPLNRHSVVLAYDGLPEQLDFGEVFVGTRGSLPLILSNRGSAELVIDRLSHGSRDLGFASGALTIPAGESAAIPLTYAPERPGSLDDTLIIESNDPDEPRIVVGLIGVALDPPLATLSPRGILAALPPFDPRSLTRTLKLENQGRTDLIWQVELREGPTDPASPPWRARAKGDEPGPGSGGRSVQHSGGPDSFGYVYRDSDEPLGPVFDWIDLAARGTAVQLAGDDGLSAALPIGFSFTFYGESFEELRISSNGWLSFSASRDSYSNADTLPNTGFAVPANLIAPFWDDLHLRGVERISYEAGDDRFIVQYTGVDRLVPGSELTFQVLLHRDGRIVFQYLDLSGTTDSATIGIQNGERTAGLLVAHDQLYAHAGLAIEFSRRPPWAVLDPPSGRLAPGAIAEVAVTLSAARLEPGNYQARAVLRSNDPWNDPLVVPLNLQVAEIVLESVVLNLDSRGTGRVEASLELPPGYDVRDVLPASVSIDRRLFAETDPVAFEDRNGDGVPELVLQFDAAGLFKLLRPGATEPLVIEGEIRDRCWFRGTVRPGVERKVAARKLADSSM